MYNMNYSGNLMLTQLRKLFQIFRASLMQNFNIFWAREGVYFIVQIMEGLEIHLEKFKPTGAHRSAAQLCVAGRPGHRLVRAHHFAVTALTTRCARQSRSLPVPTAPRGWQALSLCVIEQEQNPAPFSTLRTHFLLALLAPASAAAWLAIEHHHRSPPSSSKWRIGSAIIPSSHCTQLQPKLLASDVGSHHSPHRRLLPHGSPSTTMLCPPLGRPRVPQVPPSSLATLQTEVLLRQPSVRATVDHLAADCLPHCR
jgi:hypothetical protein